ncbi:competence protein, partial [Rhodococcus rhodochrous]
MPDDVPEGSARSSATAERIGELAADRDLTVACAESLTSAPWPPGWAP